MANNNNHNNEGKVTAGELFEKLRGSNGASAAPSGSSGQQPVGVAADEEPVALGFSEDIFSEEVFSETEGTGNGVSENGVSENGVSENGFSENGFSIDVSLEEESDSELDINELLKKYMPEYGEEADGSAVEPGGTGGGGVLSRLKRSADCADEDLPYGMDDSFMGEEDDRLISALDSAFGAEDDAEGGFHFADTPVLCVLRF